MLVVVSPAKKLDFSEDVTRSDWTQPDFLENAQDLIEYAQKLTRNEIGSLMKISDKLADLNYARYRSFSAPFTPANAKQAVFAFKGDTYVGLDADTLEEEDLAYAQDHFRILSGLYGLLRPLDLMQPYRLEMGCKLANGKGRNLYEFWADSLSEAINDILDNHDTDILVNCASQEYFKSVKTDLIQGRVVTPVFKQVKEGNARTLGMFAKRARGMMARFILTNRVDDFEGLKGFDQDGYIFQPSLSDHETLEFHKIID